MPNLYIKRDSSSTTVYQATQLLEPKIYPAWTTIRYKQFQCKEPCEAQKGDWELLDTLSYVTIVSNKDFQKDFEKFEISPGILEKLKLKLDELDLETAQNLIYIRNISHNLPEHADFLNKLARRESGGTL